MTFSRVNPAGWIQETTGSVSRTTPGGWLQETQGANAQTLLSGRYDNSQTFFAPLLTSSIALSSDLYTSSQIFFASSITSIVNLDSNLLVNNQIFYGGVLLTSFELSNSTLFSNTSVFFTPVISISISILLEASLFINNVISSIGGEVTLSPQTIADLTDSIVTALMLEIDARKFLTTNKYLALK